MLKYLHLLFLLLPFSVWGYSPEDVSSFTENYGYIAVRQMIDYDIPASIILAQAFLESKHGTSQLAKENNNFFGIKAKSDWDGPYVVMRSAEYKHHRRFVKKSRFRKYDFPEESWRDHSEFLANSRRYNRLFEKGLFNYRGWARGLQRAGYATDPKYASKLIHLIERHHLNDFDKVAFRIAHHIPINLEAVHPDNRQALRALQSIFEQVAQNTTQKELLAESAQQEKEMAESIQFDTNRTPEPAATKFYVYLSEETKPIIRQVDRSKIDHFEYKK